VFRNTGLFWYNTGLPPHRAPRTLAFSPDILTVGLFAARQTCRLRRFTDANRSSLTSSQVRVFSPYTLLFSLRVPTGTGTSRTGPRHKVKVIEGLFTFTDLNRCPRACPHPAPNTSPIGIILLQNPVRGCLLSRTQANRSSLPSFHLP